MSDSDYDAVVIGSGAGGGASAFGLARAGLHVLLLEAGPSYDPHTDYNLHGADWEQRGFPHKVEPKERQTIAPLQMLSQRFDDLRSWNHLTGRRDIGNRREAVGYHHVVGLGGSTLQFTGEAHRLNPNSMKMYSQFGVAADWPFDYDELEPFYVDAERIIGVAGPSDNTRWRSRPCPLPPHLPSYASQRLGEACKGLGYSWAPNYLAALSQPYDGRPSCNYCGNCARGCPRLDKGSVDVTFIDQAIRSGNCDIKTNAQVTRLEAGADDRIQRVHFVSADGAAHVVKGRAIVIACGAIETPRLLLASMGTHAPQGIGNESGHVGKHFMETLYWTSSGLHPDPLASYRGLPSDSICWDFNAPDAIPDVIGGCRFAPSVAESDLLGPISYARRVVGGWGKQHKAAMRENFGNVLSLGAIGENLPNKNSFVDLDPDVVDPNGIPLAKIHSHLPDHELERVKFMAHTAREILGAAGVGKIFEEYGAYDAFNSTHVFGTCRMGIDPSTSVVNAFGRSHRWRNLFITDASVFPSSGGGEGPALTIEALALRSSAYIATLATRREL